jgi:hypothetical protein
MDAGGGLSTNYTEHMHLCGIFCLLVQQTKVRATLDAEGGLSAINMVQAHSCDVSGRFMTRESCQQPVELTAYELLAEHCAAHAVISSFMQQPQHK